MTSTSICHYCLATIGPRRAVAESHVHYSGGVHVLCSGCAPHVERVHTAVMVDRLARETTPTDAAQEFRWMFPAAQKFIAGGTPSDDREVIAFGKWSELRKSPPEEWMPIAARGIVDVQWSEVPRWIPHGEIDGRHRLSLAVAVGHALTRRCPARVPTVPITPDYVYQTLAFPDGFVHGERTLDRFALWPREDLDGKRIVELACATGVDGTLLCTLGARNYHGVDLAPNAALAAKIAAAWGVGDRSTFSAADLATERPWIPPSDVAWILSSAIQIPREVHLWAVRESSARLVFFETHREEGHVDDEPSRALMAALPVKSWALIGASAYDAANMDRKCRRLYRGEIEA